MRSRDSRGGAAAADEPEKASKARASKGSSSLTMPLIGVVLIVAVFMITAPLPSHDEIVAAVV